MPLPLSDLVCLARGEVQPDLVLADAQIVNVFAGTIEAADVAIARGTIVGVGRGWRGRHVVDLAGRYVAPGFIDAHVHLESSLVRPSELARVVVARGVTTVIADPHEIANVLGVAGIRFLREEARAAPWTLFLTAPPCVPASTMSTSGASVSAEELAALREEPDVVGLGEVMDFPAVVAGDPDMLAKLEIFRGRAIDGHCPGLAGRALGAYVAAGIGSDHECTTAAEATAKLGLGLTIFLREASTARNLRDLLPALTPENARRFCLCTDDRTPDDLLDEGSVDHLVRVAIEAGVPPVTAIRLATLHPAEHFGLRDRGAIAPGRRADLVVFDELGAPRAGAVYVAGQLVAHDGALTRRPVAGRVAQVVQRSVHVEWSRVELRVRAAGREVRAIRVLPDQVITECEIVPAPIRDGFAFAAPEADLLKIAVLERHGRNGNVAVGFVRGVGLRRGALASTVAHDHHNLVVVGADDPSMWTAARAVADAGGGQAAAIGDRVLALLPLPIAGLMSDRPVEAVREERGRVLAAAAALDSPLHDPLATMSFLGMERIPRLKITDMGLVDVDRGAHVPLFVEERS